MTSVSTSGSRSAWLGPPRLLAIFALACVIAGTLARFWALGKWPLAIDEYYFERSVQNVLAFGVPRYPCGGLYVRGLFLQYGAALLQLVGLTPELAPRFIAAVASLIALPAAYALGRRLGGRQAGLLAVALLALSVWEVEIGRFGRMYAPFQALFLWYLVFFVRYALDGQRRALAPMLILSALGLGTWEGGIFLVLTNFLPPFIAHPDGRLSRRDWLYLAGCALLLVPAYILAIADLRTTGGEPTLPPNYVEPADTVSLSRLDVATMPWTTLHHHLGWLIAALVPTVLVLYAVWSGIRHRIRWNGLDLPALAILAILASAALQQFALAAGVTLVALLLGILDLRSLMGSASRPLHLALAATFLFWVCFALSTADWHVPGLSGRQTVMQLAYEFVRFPDIVRQIATPWARTVPMLSAGLAILLTASCVRAVVRFDATPPAERILLAVFVILLLAAGASDPPRHETRYVFFLYPLALLFSIVTLGRALRAMLGPTAIGTNVAAIVCIALFALSEDFQPAHLWNIDSEAINFRIGMSGYLAGHYHPRTDVRSAALFLQEHVIPGQDTVIASFPGVDFYYRNSDFYFVADTDARFEGWSCQRGTVQRWSNLPLIHSYDTLAAKVASGRRVWMVVESSVLPQIVSKLPPASWTVAWTSRARDITILAFHSVGNGPAPQT